MKKHTDHPEHYLKLYDKNKTLNCLWRKIERGHLTNIATDYRLWPSYVFAPTSYWHWAMKDVGVQPVVSPKQLEIMAQDMMFLGTFRYTKDIYKFDPTLLKHLIDTPIIDVNAKALTRLPEYCIYVDVGGAAFTVSGKNVIGFYATYDDDMAQHRVYDFAHLGAETATLLRKYPTKILLRFLYDDEEKDNIYNTSIPLLDGTIYEAWNEVHKIRDEVTELGHMIINHGRELVPTEFDVLAKVLPILLYLCTEDPEIKDRKCSKLSKVPYYQKDKAKRLFSPGIVRYWDVGKELGKKLERQEREGRAINAKTPHLRRAHWHGFWKGPRDGERELVYKWLPPIFVGDKEHEKENN